MTVSLRRDRRRMRLTMTRILAQADSRRFQSMVTLFRTLITSSTAMTFSSSTPITCIAPSFAASAVKADFLVVQAEVLTAPADFPHFLRQTNQLVDEFVGGDRHVVVDRSSRS